MSRTTKKERPGKKAGTKKAARPRGQEKKTGARRKKERTGLRAEAESRLRQQTDRMQELSGQDKDALLHELGTHQIELEMQNEYLRQDQAELEASRARLADLYDFAPVGYFTFDPNGAITSVNLTGAAMLGEDREILLQEKFAAFIAWSDRDRFHRHIRKILREDGGQTAELRLQDRKGDGFRHIKLDSILIRDDAGKIAEIRSTLSDITERKITEERLEQKNALLRAIIDHTDVLMAYLDRDFNFVWVNRSYAESCNMDPRELAGRNHFDLFSHAGNEDIFRQVRDSGEPVFYKDKPFTFKDQPERGITYWDWTLAPVKDAAGLVVGLVLSLRETTQYMQMQMALAESEERFRSMAETSIDIIFQVDYSGRILYVSPSVDSMGYSPEYVKGRSIDEFITAEDIAKAEAALRQVLKGNGIKLFELGLLKSDCTVVACEINANPIVWEGMIVGVQGIARDISERKRAENIIRRNEAQLKAVLNHLTEGVIVSDLDGNLIFWNPAAVRLHGFSSKEEYLRRLPDFQQIFELATAEDGILPVESWPMSRILQGESLEDCEIIVRRRDVNRERIYNYGGTLARDSEGKPLLAILTVSDITERNYAEKRIKLQYAVLTGINIIFKAGMQCESDQELAIEALLVAEQITASRFGFIGEIGPDGLLHDLAMSNSGWEQCAMIDKTGHRRPPGDFAIAGLYGHVLNEGKAFYANDPAAHPASVATPEGHPPLTAFLGVPLLHGDRAVGLVALANKDGGYRQGDIETVKTLATAFVETLFKCRAERALAESEARERINAEQFRQFVDFTPIPVFIAHDPGCRYITANKAGARMLGVETDTNLSQTPRPGEETPPVVHIKNGRRVVPEEMPLQYVVRQGTAVENIEMGMVMPDGSVRQMLGAATPLFDDAGRVRGGIAAYIDITERKRVEEQLLDAKQEWETTFDAVPDLIAVLDADHRIVRANRSMAERLGLAPDELVGRKCYACCHGSTGPAANCPHVKTVQDGREHRAELLEERLGGYYLVTTTPIFDEEGKFTRSIHMARDITEQKKAEWAIKNLNTELQQSLVQLAVTNKNLQRSNEDLQHFASIVSHDLQEPLRTVSSFVQLIARRYEDRLDDKGIIFMQHIVEGTNHMQRLLNDLLAYSRVGGGKLDMQPVSLENVLKDIKRKIDRRIKENRAEITSSGLPVVYGDEMQIFTLLQNLISNALKYRSHEPPRIQVSAAQDEGNDWRICVEDNGIGFDPKHAEQIFLIFQRLHLRHEYKGTGIGLSVCKKIVERHGGRIWAESVPDRGSSFCFTLPASEKESYEE